MLKYVKSIICGNPFKKFKKMLPLIYSNNKNHDSKDTIKYRTHNDVPTPDFDDYRKTELENAHSSTSASADERRGKIALVTLTMSTMALYGGKTAIIQIISSMAPSADVLAISKSEIKLNDITEGKTKVFKWRGKPVFVTHRSQEIISQERETILSLLRDPQTDQDRTKRPEWLIVIGVCTHLGCIPIPNSGNFKGGYYCPCHGSHYDASGRIRKGPAPTNLAIPPYEFIDDSNVLVG